MSSHQDVDKGKTSTSGKESTPRLGARALLSRHFMGPLGNSPGRLSSLRPPRDLTLGGSPRSSALQINTPKRVFTPNIPSRRIKEEPKDDSLREEKPAKVVKDNERGRRSSRDGQGRGSRGRGNNRSKPEIIQSSSVFSMGPANKVKAGLTTPSVGFGGTRSSESKATPGAFKKEKYSKIEDDEATRVLQMLQDDGDIEEDKSMHEAGLAPIHLPLAQHSLKLKEQSLNDQVTGINIKTEAMDIDIDEKKNKKKLIKPVKHVPVKTEGRESPVSCASLFNPEMLNEETQLLFMQFPDVLPISTSTPDTGEPMNTDQPGTSGNNPTSKSKDAAKPNLEDVSEGYIGKLQILKSGKTRLVLGNVVMDVAVGSPCGFLQDLVAIHTENNRSDMVVLGHVRHRLVCTPDFERLLTS